MTLEQWSSLSQIVAAAGVLASLLFVGFQIRQNTLAMIAQSQQHIATSWFTMGQLVADHAPAFGAGLRSKDPAFADLKDEDRLRFVSIIFALFKHYECQSHLDIDRRRLSKSYRVRKRPGVEFELSYDSAHDGHEAEPASLFTGQVVAGRTI